MSVVIDPLAETIKYKYKIDIYIFNFYLFVK